MRAAAFSFVCLLVLACFATEMAKPGPVPPGPGKMQAGLEFTGAAPNLPAAQVRSPETVINQPGPWPEQGKKRRVDVTQLKSEAQELTTLTQSLPAQMEQIGNGKLPKELIENLKKIEKLAKHIRGEVS